MQWSSADMCGASRDQLPQHLLAVLTVRRAPVAPLKFGVTLLPRILRRGENKEVCKAGSLLAPHRWIACFQNRARGSEDARCVVIRDFLFTF